MDCLRRHAAFAVLLLACAPLLVLFGAHDGISGMGDDSVSYLTLARHFSGTAGPFLEPSVQHHGHLPPLFPLILAALGGPESLRVAHGAVSAFAIASIVLAYAYFNLQLGHATAALALTAMFLIMPTAWISNKGILSESTYLCFSLAALGYYSWRLAKSTMAGTADWATLGLILAAACLTRVAGVFLLLAYCVHMAIRLAREPGARRWRALLPPVMAACALALWVALRPPQPEDVYRHLADGALREWIDDPMGSLRISLPLLWGGWVASFMASSDVSPVAKGILALFGMLALIGTARRVLANRLDGWYVALYLPAVLAWFFSEEHMRRLLFPAIPLLILHAAEAVSVAARWIGRGGRHVAVAVLLLPAMIAIPAASLVARRAVDKAPLVEDGRYSASDITDYYTILSDAQARIGAAREAAVLHGLERLRTDTPMEARIMWVRPEYVALLGERQPVAFLYQWDSRALAEAIRSTRTTHVIVSSVWKSDLRGVFPDGDQRVAALRSATRYSVPEYAVRNAVTGKDEFILLKVVPTQLAAFLEALPAARGT